MNAVYWGVTALCIMKHKDALDAEETIQYVMSCWDDEAGTPRYSNSLFDRLTPMPVEGAFGAHPGHDAHILSTLSAIQVLATHDALARLDARRVIDCTSHIPPRPPPYCSSKGGASHPGPAAALGHLRRRRIRRDRHALPLLRRVRAIAARRARQARSRAHRGVPRRVPQFRRGLWARRGRREPRGARCVPYRPRWMGSPPQTCLTHARSMGVHGCACDPRSIGRDRRVDARMVACREAAAQRGAKREA